MTKIESALKEFEQSAGSSATCHIHFDPLPPKYSEFPESINPLIVDSLKSVGIEKPYIHQSESIKLTIEGKNVVVVTPTASGKTLCYNVPILNELLKNPSARAMYLFPTKALSRDQLDELYNLVKLTKKDIKVYTFDGDTPTSARKAIKSSGNIIVTNPDMLHTGILPHHTNWIKLFENLRFIVIDEIHHYRGVFGSHFANVLRRLKRICKFYGADPQFICCSATIANPKELAEKITGEIFEVVDNCGAPTGAKHFVFYNPPVVNYELGIRKSVVNEAVKVAMHFLKRKIQTILFARSRLRVELLATYLKKAMEQEQKSPDLVKAYRGGYLPSERRSIEEGLRESKLLGVVSTNALELGIDIGQLDVSIMAGYPGTIASAWQQAGRAGRRSGSSIMIMLASSLPLDQYVVNHPEYFFGNTPENGIINPDNPVIVISHLKCAAFELPFDDGEKFGDLDIEPALESLEVSRILRHTGNRWYYTSDSYPAENVSLRTSSPGNFVVVDVTNNNAVIGEIDYKSAFSIIHPGAIYIHQSITYFIRELDIENRVAYAEQSDVDYYTDAEEKTEIKILTIDKEKCLADKKDNFLFANFGAISVTTLTAKFKKVKFETHDNIGWGDLSLPEQEMQTESAWFCFPDSFQDIMGKDFDVGGGLRAISTALRNVIPLYVMCDPMDIRVVPMVKSPATQKPTIFIYDYYPGGIGISEKVFEKAETILSSVKELINSCRCASGCPSCVGPLLEIGSLGKKTSFQMLKILV